MTFNEISNNHNTDHINNDNRLDLGKIRTSNQEMADKESKTVQGEEVQDVQEVNVRSL